jgi:16S rRNA (guanine527-N7)-methyltransferase
VDTSSIAGLLQSYIQLDESRLSAISKYIDLLLKWNARINLTAIREPKEIVRRHFGESFFAASHILKTGTIQNAIDLGSGAGFPGVPFAMYAPEVSVTLIEAHQKKATFLRELVFQLGLKNVTVFADRGEKYGGTADVVTMRAVESFQDALPVAANLADSDGKVALLIGSQQIEAAEKLCNSVKWSTPIGIPESHSRTLLIGTKIVKVE